LLEALDYKYEKVLHGSFGVTFRNTGCKDGVKSGQIEENVQNGESKKSRKIRIFRRSARLSVAPMMDGRVFAEGPCFVGILNVGGFL